MSKKRSADEAQLLVPTKCNTSVFVEKRYKIDYIVKLKQYCEMYKREICKCEELVAEKEKIYKRKRETNSKITNIKNDISKLTDAIKVVEAKMYEYIAESVDKFDDAKRKEFDSEKERLSKEIDAKKNDLAKLEPTVKYYTKEKKEIDQKISSIKQDICPREFSFADIVFSTTESPFSYDVKSTTIGTIEYSSIQEFKKLHVKYQELVNSHAVKFSGYFFDGEYDEVYYEPFSSFSFSKPGGLFGV